MPTKTELPPCADPDFVRDVVIHVNSLDRLAVLSLPEKLRTIADAPLLRPLVRSQAAELYDRWPSRAIVKDAVTSGQSAEEIGVPFAQTVIFLNTLTNTALDLAPVDCRWPNLSAEFDDLIRRAEKACAPAVADGADSL